MSVEQLTRQDVEALIVKRAWSNEEFRQEFLADPKATIEKYGGQKLPEDLRILAHPEDDRTIHFVIPAKPVNADELSDEDLEKVAGGIDVGTGFIIATVALFAIAAAGGINGHVKNTTGQGW